MTKIKRLSQKNKYYLPYSARCAAIYYARQYQEWEVERKAIENTSKAISYDGDRVQTSGDSDPTFSASEKAEELANKMKLIEDTVRAADSQIYYYLLLAVGYGLTFDQLKAFGMPAEKDMFYDRRRKFYFLLSKKI